MKSGLKRSKRTEEEAIFNITGLMGASREDVPWIPDDLWKRLNRRPHRNKEECIDYEFRRGLELEDIERKEREDAKKNKEKAKANRG